MIQNAAMVLFLVTPTFISLTTFVYFLGIKLITNYFDQKKKFLNEISQLVPSEKTNLTGGN